MEKRKLNLVKIADSLINDSELKELTGGMMAVACYGDSCGSNATVNVNNALKAMRKANPPQLPQL